MNICFLGGGFDQFGGIERVTSIVANEIAERNLAKVYTLSMSDHGQNVYPLSAKIIRSSFFEERYSMKLALCKGVLGKAVQFIRKNQLDIIIACGVIYFPIACIAAKLTGIKSVCWEHKNPSSQNEVTLEKESRFIGAHFSNANVLISEAALKYYNKTYRNKNNYLVHNPADSELFSDHQPYDKNSCQLISVGRLTYQKNYPLLLEVAKRVLPEHSDWSWDIFGEGDECDILNGLIEKYGLTGKVTLRGTIPDLYDHYPRYSAIVMTSRWEGFPMVLIEGAAKGLPMISFDVPTGPNEIIMDGVNGFLIPAGDVDKMVERIHEFICNPELRENMSKNSKEASRRFGIDNTVRCWTDLLECLANQEE